MCMYVQYRTFVTTFAQRYQMFCPLMYSVNNNYMHVEPVSVMYWPSLSFVHHIWVTGRLCMRMSTCISKIAPLNRYSYNILTSFQAWLQWMQEHFLLPGWEKHGCESIIYVYVMKYVFNHMACHMYLVRLLRYRFWGNLSLVVVFLISVRSCVNLLVRLYSFVYMLYTVLTPYV